MFCCLDGESVLLKTLDYFVKSSTQFSVDCSMMSMSGSDVFSPREREQLNRFINKSFAIIPVDIHHFHIHSQHMVLQHMVLYFSFVNYVQKLCI